jgi:hypothetical protein
MYLSLIDEARIFGLTLQVIVVGMLAWLDSRRVYPADR